MTVGDHVVDLKQPVKVQGQFHGHRMDIRALFWNFYFDRKNPPKNRKKINENCKKQNFRQKQILNIWLNR